MARINILTYSIICYLVITPVLDKVSGDVIYYPEALGIENCEFEHTGAPGKCIPLDDCAYAKDLLQPWKNSLQICAYNRSSPIVCCPSKTPFTGQRSEKQCRENWIFFFNSHKNRILAERATRAKAKEFIHMALLGYGNEDDNHWLCGGTLLNEKFVLTAAHCLFPTDFGPLRLVRLGELDINDSQEDAKPQDFNISKIFRHPKYQSPSHYHDIGLIKLDRPVLYNQYVLPACLYVPRNLPVNLTATGWGKLQHFDTSGTNYLMQVELSPASHKKCAKRFANASKRKLPNGIIDDLQFCAGNSNSQVTCPGDSGGPIQFKDAEKMLYYIVGVISFGKACGIENSLGVYTRVASYIDWIEDIVWPLEPKN